MRNSSCNINIEIIFFQIGIKKHKNNYNRVTFRNVFVTRNASDLLLY